MLICFLYFLTLDDDKTIARDELNIPGLFYFFNFF